MVFESESLIFRMSFFSSLLPLRVDEARGALSTSLSQPLELINQQQQHF